MTTKALSLYTNISKTETWSNKRTLYEYYNIITGGNPTPKINTVSSGVRAGETLTINGEGFGKQQAYDAPNYGYDGHVFIDGIECGVTVWGWYQISITIPLSINRGYHNLTVVQNQPAPARTSNIYNLYVAGERRPEPITLSGSGSITGIGSIGKWGRVALSTESAIIPIASAIRMAQANIITESGFVASQGNKIYVPEKNFDPSFNNVIHYDIPTIRFNKTFRRGQVLTILGTAKYGPVNQPVLLSDPTNVYSIFGTREYGTLVKAYEQVSSTNLDIDIYLVRVTGTHAGRNLLGLENGERLIPDMFNLRAVGAGQTYNEIRVQFMNEELPSGGYTNYMKFEFPQETGLSTIIYPFEAYPRLGQLVDAINRDSENGYNLVYASCADGLQSCMNVLGINPNDFYLTGGEDGLYPTKNDLYIALNETYQLLDGFYTDFIVPAGVYLDDVHPVSIYGEAIYGSSYYASGDDYLDLVDTYNGNSICTFHGQLIDFCKRQMRFGSMPHGVIGLKPVRDISDITRNDYSYILKLLDATAFGRGTDLRVFSDGEYKDQGHYLSVVAAEPFFLDDTVNEYSDNGAVIYASMLAGLGGKTTTTNQLVPGIEAQRYEFTSSELKTLTELGVVAFRSSVYAEGIVVSNGVTAALQESDLHNIGNVRQIQLVLVGLNQLVDSVIGEPYSPMVKKKELEKSLKAYLDLQKDRGLLKNYRMSVAIGREGTGVIAVDLLAMYATEYLSARNSINLAEKRG